MALFKKKKSFAEEAAAHQTPETAALPLFADSGIHHLKATGITQTFLDEDGREVWALDNFSLEVNGPEIVGIIGPSGCGKSTFLRLVTGLDDPLSGEILFDGEPISGPSVDRSMVFQNANLLEWLTVYENIATGLRINKTYDEYTYKIPRLIKMMGLEGFEDSYPTQLSGGMASRCALARAFVLNPALICFDEPLSALDAFTRAALQDEILAMQAQAQTSMIVVTHDIEEAVYLCDRVIVMTPRPGRVKSELKIDLPHPRNRTDEQFVAIRRQLLAVLES